MVELYNEYVSEMHRLYQGYDGVPVRSDLSKLEANTNVERDEEERRYEVEAVKGRITLLNDDGSVNEVWYKVVWKNWTSTQWIPEYYMNAKHLIREYDRKIRILRGSN
jgi:hypothetical protein